MKKHILIFLALLPMAVHGQTLTTYTATSEQGAWQSISATGTLLASVTGDYGIQPLALPFDFMYGNSEYTAGTNIMVRADGFVVLRGSSGGHNALSYWNQPSYSIISPFPLKDGQLPAGTSGCWYQVTTDDNGEEMLVIEYNGLQRYPTYPITAAEASQDNFNYQLRLHANGNISAVYGHMHSGVASDSLFNFILTDGATVIGNTMDQISLRGTWDSVIASTNTIPGYRSGNNWVIIPNSNLAGVPDSGTVVTWHRPLPPCPRPTAITVSHIGHDTALLTWVGNDVEGAYYYIQYDTVNFIPGGTGHHLGLYVVDTIHLTGLVSNHQYYLYMRSDCGADSSDWFSVSFHTPCAPILHNQLPFTEDFDSRPDSDPTLWDGCWWGYNGVAVKDISSWDGHPNMALRVMNIGWMRLPPVDSVRTTVIRFRAHGPLSGTGSKILYVGVLGDPYDINTFDTLQTFTLSPSSSGESGWLELMVPFASYSGTGNTVAFRWDGVGQAFVDDIEISVFDGCLPVDMVTVDAVGQHDATVHWSVYVPADSNRVVWYPVGNAAAADSLTVSSDSLAIGSLTSNTDYVAKVYSLCSDTSASEAVSAVFHTRCAEPLPLDEDFDDLTSLPACWATTSFMNFHTTGSYTPAVPTIVDSSVQFSSEYTNEYHYEQGILLLPFVDTAVNRLRLTFDYRVERFAGLMSMIVGVVPSDDYTEAYIPVATIYPNDTLWHSYTVETGAVPISEGRVVMIQHSTGDHAYIQGYWRDLGHVDNIHIEALPACDRPAAVWVTHITSSTALVHWQENNSLGTYEVTCGDNTYTVIGDTVLALTGLTPAESYAVDVRRLCEGEYTYARSAWFVTACEPITQLPWHEDFEQWPVEEIDPCWLRHYAGLNGSNVEGCDAGAFLTTTYGNRMLKMKAMNYSFDPQPYDAIAVLPEVGLPLDGLAIGFTVGAPYSGNSQTSIILELGLMDDGGDSTTFRVIDTVAVEEDWSYYEHAFGAADSGRLALRMKMLNGQANLYVDNLGLFVAMGCPRPEALMVDTVTQHTVTVTVVDSSLTGHYRLYWQLPTSPIIDSMDVDSNTATVTGLASGRTYIVHAAALCGTSLSNTVSTQCITDCDTIAHSDLPYHESFDGNNLNHCWTVLPDGNNNVQVNNHQLKLAHYPSNGQPMAIMPPVDTLAGIDLTFQACAVFASDGAVIVGVMSNPDNAESFIPVDTLEVDTNVTWHQVTMTDVSHLGHHIAFMPLSHDSTWSAILNLDNVTLSQSLPCARPDSVTVDSIGATTATLTVNDLNDNLHYRVICTSTYGTTSQFIDFDSTDSAYSFNLTGLIPSTEYIVEVSSVCYDSSITFAVSTSFITDCAPMPLPWRQGFETESKYKTPRCWEIVQGTGRVYTGSNVAEGSRALTVLMEDSVAWMDISTSEIGFGDDSVRIVFYAKVSQGYTDNSLHYHALDMRLQVFAALGDSLILLHEDTVDNTWRLVSFQAAPLPYGARLLLRAWRTAGASGSTYLLLDEFRVSTPAPVPQCNSVTSLTAVDIDYLQATVSWIPQGNEERWEVHLRGGNTNSTVIVDSTVVTFTELTHSTTYACIVRALCSDSLSGPWSDTLFFTTSGCLPVDSITVTAVTSTTADIIWPVAEGQSGWIVNYGPQSFPQGTGFYDTVYLFEPSTSTGTQLTHLEPQTTYDVYIRTLCSEGMQSIWSAPVTFTTATADITTAALAELTIGPNPTDGAVHIGGLPHGATTTLLDTQGRVLSSEKAADGTVVFDLSRMPAGVYFLRVVYGEEAMTKKIVKGI